MLARKEIDMTASLLMIEDENSETEVIDYSRTIAMAPNGFVTLMSTVESSGLLSITQPFQLHLWVLIGCTIAFLKGLVLLLPRWNSNLEKSHGGRLLQVTKLLFFSFVLTRCYRLNLFTSFVTKSKSFLPFDSLVTFSQALGSGRVQFAVINDEIINFYNRSNGVVYEDIIAALPANPVIKIPNEEQLIQRISKSPNLVYHTSYASFLYKTSRFAGDRQCTLAFLQTTQSQLAFAFPKGSRLTEKVSQLLYTAEYSAEDWDIYLMTRDNYIRPRRCGFESKKRSQSRRKLDLSHFTSCFFLLSNGVICSLIAFCLEKMPRRLQLIRVPNSLVMVTLLRQRH